ncbi:MAG: NnrS family protein, partial [Steroidobacteraceae bacterium]
MDETLITPSRIRGVTLRAFVSYGFRPFFLAAGLWAAAAIGLWIAVLTGGLSLPTRFDPLTWHIHEMLFGFVLAAIAGFLLTAIPSWTGRRPVSGPLLGALLGLWALARIDSLACEYIPTGLAIVADLAFPVALAVIVAREIIAARNRRNMPIIAPVIVLGAANLLVDLSMEGFATLAGYGWRAALAAILILMSVIGGRIVPSFTRNWLVKRKAAGLPAAAGILDRGSLGALHAALVIWVFFPQALITGIALLTGAAINLWRLLRWRGIATRSEPLLLILHLGYGWLVLGVGVLGVSTLDVAFPLNAAI